MGRWVSFSLDMPSSAEVSPIWGSRRSSSVTSRWPSVSSLPRSAGLFPSCFDRGWRGCLSRSRSGAPFARFRFFTATASTPCETPQCGATARFALVVASCVLQERASGAARAVLQTLPALVFRLGPSRLGYRPRRRRRDSDGAGDRCQAPGPESRPCGGSPRRGGDISPARPRRRRRARHAHARPAWRSGRSRRPGRWRSSSRHPLPVAVSWRCSSPSVSWRYSARWPLPERSRQPACALA